MKSGFIPSTRDTLFGHIDSRCYRLGDAANTTLLINVMPPGSATPPHSHDEHQIGLCLSGRLTMNVSGEEQVLDALRTCYWAPSGTLHAGRNDSDQPAVTLDIKRKPQPQDVQLTHCPSERRFLPLSDSKHIKGGLDLAFFIGPWFEIMHSHLAPGARMPRHAHRGIQIGVGLTGSYSMEVADEARPFGPYDVYFAADHVPHAGHNDTPEGASSLNIFIPPRWNLLPAREREIAL